jgi:pyruvate dehydrogenase E2 component (dihydrolipoamide acetyltransferase)
MTTATTDITMPSLSDSMQEGTILAWLKADGDRVDVGEELVEIETDKATVTYESPSAGVLKIVASVGETLPVGEPIARLGEEAAGEPSGPAEARPLESSTTDAAPAPVAANGNGAGGQSVRATPLARRLASVHGVDLDELEGSGPRGRITRADVAARAGIEDPTVSGAEEGRRVADGDRAGDGDRVGDGGREGVRVQELTRTQQLIARRMSEAKATIPEFQVQTEAQVDALLALRSELKSELADDQSLIPSVNDFIVKACALALRRHPRANGSYRDGHFELHERVNVGIAVATDDALVVPTITDADQRPLSSIAAEARRLAVRVREGTVTPPELSGATFTVSNLGMYGMSAITPVINPPQAAILGVGAARGVAAVVDDELVTRHLLTLTLSCDHRILYGADAAQFLSDIRDGLEAPLGLLLR